MFSAFFAFLCGSTGLGLVVVIIYLIYKGLKQASEPEARHGYNKNKELLWRDRFINNLSEEEIKKNLANGKYYSKKVISEFASQNRCEEYRTRIVDTKRYNEDLQKYGKKMTEEMREMGCYTYIL